MSTVDLRYGDALDVLRALAVNSVQCVVTSPPYWGLRDYGVAGQLGLEQTPEEYVARLVEVFREVRRVLRADGTVWLNLGDSYATGAGKVGDCPGGGEQGERWRGEGSKHDYGIGPVTQPNRMPIPGLKPKDLVGIPWRVAFALQADGWWLRSDIIWAKRNPMPESVTDRPTKAHEYVFLLAKSERYYYDAAAIKEPLLSGPSDLRKMAESLPRIGGKHKDLNDPLSKASSLTNIARKRSVGNKQAALAALDARGHRYASLGSAADRSESGEIGGRNRRTVWTIPTQPFPGAHFAVMPEALVEPCIAAGSREGDLVLDPFCGSGTVGVVAARAGRDFLGIELNAEYVAMARRRINGAAPLFVAHLDTLQSRT